MPKSRPFALLSSGVVVAAVIGGVALITVGEAFNGSPPAGARQITATIVTLTTSAVSPVTQGAPVALTATVTPLSVGNVQFKDGITNLGGPVRVSNGAASGSTSSLAAGSHSLIAVFTPGDPSTYGSSTSPATMLVVAGAPATTTALATSPASPVVQGTPVTLTATITPATATGTVQFKDGANSLGPPVTVSSGIASGSTSALIVGPHQLTAVFAPANPVAFNPSTSSSAPIVVAAPAAPVTTSTSLAASPESPVAEGTPVTLTATITPPTATGTVQFKDGTRNVGNPVAVSNGTASGSTSTLAVGSRSLTAVFTPNTPALYSTSTSPPLTFVITASSRTTATSTTLVTSPASPVRRGTQVALIATISPAAAAGTVQFKDGVSNLGNPVIVNNGTASITTSTLAVGGHQLTAVFSPTDPAFTSSTSPVLAFEVTDPGLADLSACLKVLQNCPTPRAGAPWPSALIELISTSLM